MTTNRNTRSRPFTLSRSLHTDACYAFVLVVPWLFLLRAEPIHALSNDSHANSERVTHVDFLNQLDRAHIRQNGPIIDLGNAGFHKYTVGDWHKAWKTTPGKATEHTTLTASRGEIRFQGLIDDEGSCVVGIRGRAGSVGLASLFLNQIYLGDLSFPENGFVYREIAAPQGIRPGENIIEIIPKAHSNHSDSASISLDIDYIRVIPDSQRFTDNITSQEVPFDSLAHSTEGLWLRDESELAFNLFIPDNSRLRLQLSEPSRHVGHLEVSVETDFGETILESYEISTAQEIHEISLRQISFEAARITFRAVGGDVIIQDARIVQTRRSNGPTKNFSPIKNALVVVVDTLRKDRLRVYNRSTNVKAPGLAKLARESVVFERAFAQSNWTKPSVATLLSGLYPLTHMATTHSAQLPTNIVTMPEHFRRNGFSTAGFVANGYITDKFGFGQGWQHFDGYGTRLKPEHGRYVIQDAIRWIKNRSPNDRFFAYVHTTDVHAPYVSPKHIWSSYDPGTYRGVIRPRETASLLNLIRAGTLLLNRRDIFRLQALYNGAISYHDQSIGRLMDVLETTGILDETLVVFTSDHGEEFFDHGSVGHGHTLFEELIHIPLLFRLPKKMSVYSQHVYEEVGLVDILPTLCELLGVEPPSMIQGESIVSLFMGNDTGPQKEAVVSEFPNENQFALRNSRFKGIFHQFDTKLYDIFSDPNERTDRSRDYPIAKMAMTDILGSHLGVLEASKKNAEGKISLPGNPIPATIDPETRARLQALGYLGE